MAWLAMAANKMRTLLTMGNYYRYCVGGVDCGGRRRRKTDGTGGYPRYVGTNTIDIHPCKDFGDDKFAVSTGAEI